ncbi:MAG: hypothetical protein ABIT08_12490 [Bacteroidia bacterium]
MTTASLKKNIFKAIDQINDVDYLRSIYHIIAGRIIESDYPLTKEQLKILKEREAKYLSGKSKTFKGEEVKDNARRKASVK